MPRLSLLSFSRFLFSPLSCSCVPRIAALGLCRYERTVAPRVQAPPVAPARVRQIDLNLLVALDALLAEGNVTRAAEKLGLSQPAMSHALNRLRALLDDPILVRTPRGMVPTPRAEEL